MKLMLAAVFLSLLLGSTYAQGLGANYEIIVNQNGNAFVQATFSGDGAVLMPLPQDVSSPYVKGALYTKSDHSIILSVTKDRMATVSYRTDELTRKTGKSWDLSLVLPGNLTNTYVSIALPKTASLLEVSPSDGVIMNEADSLVVAWTSSSSLRETSVKYEFPQGTGEGDGAQTEQKDGWSIEMLATAAGLGLLAIIALAALAYVAYPMLRGKSKCVCITDGMRNVMKALNENDVKIVEEVANFGGEMRRSELERKTGIAKSSLALSLDRMEEKGIVTVDKETTTHRVSLTEWFRSL